MLNFTFANHNKQVDHNFSCQIYFVEIQRTVPAEKHALDVVGVEEESVFVPAELRQGWVGTEMAFEETWTTKR